MGRAARYLPDVAPFVALADPADPQHWLDAAELVGPGGTFAIAGSGRSAAGRLDRRTGGIDGVQMVDVDLAKEPDPEAVRLTAERCPGDAGPGRSHPARPVPGRGPSNSVPTSESGATVHWSRWPVSDCIRRAGPRSAPSAPIPLIAGRDLATRLVSAVGAGIADRGDRVLLHAAAHNVTAIGLYLSIGFRLRRVTTFNSVTVPLLITEIVALFEKAPGVGRYARLRRVLCVHRVSVTDCLTAKCKCTNINN